MTETSATEPQADPIPALCSWTDAGPNAGWKLRVTLPASLVPSEAEPGTGKEIFSDLNGLTDRRDVPGGVMTRGSDLAGEETYSIELTAPKGFRGSLQFLPVPEGIGAADRPTWLDVLEGAFIPGGHHGLREVTDMRGRRVLEVAAPDARPLIWTGESESASDARQDEGAGSPAVDEQVITLGSSPRRIWIHRPERAPASAPVLVLFDGERFVRGGLLTAIDELVSPPSTVIAVDHTPVGGTGPVDGSASDQRADDLVMNLRFCDDVLALVRRTSPGVSARTIVAGASYGGLAAAFFSLRHPASFRGISLSPSFWEADEQGRRIWDFVASGPRDGRTAVLDPEHAGAARLRPTFCVDHGILETTIAESVDEATEEFASRGIAVASRPFVGGHEYLWWRELMLVRLAEILAEPA